MKIAMISQPSDGIIPPKQGSIGIWIYQVASLMSESADTTVFASWKPSQRHSGNINGFKLNLVYSLPGRMWDMLSPLYSLLRSRKRSFFVSRFCHIEYSLQVALHLKKHPCDVAHVHNFPQCAWWIRRFNPDTKIVLHMHCQWLSQVNAQQLNQLLPSVDLIVGVSDFITNKIHKRFPKLADQCRTVYNGVNLHAFPQCLPPDPDNPKQLLYVGRISPEKGLHVLIAAFCQIASDFPELTLNVIGPEWVTPKDWLVSLSSETDVAALKQCYESTDNNNKPIGYLQQLKAQLTPELATRVHFIGLVPYDQLVDYYQKADILISPSFSEAFSMPIAEAMISGIPAIGARVGGIPEVIIDGKTGILFEPGDIQALSTACKRLLNDDELRKTMGQTARQIGVERFTWHAITAQLLKHYRSITKT